MPSPVTLREHRLRKSKAQLVDELESFERRVAALEVGRDGSASGGGKPPSSDDYLANQTLLDLAKFPSENPNPVLRVTPEGGLLYTNDAARAVKGLLTGRKKGRLPSDPRKSSSASCQKPRPAKFRSLSRGKKPARFEACNLTAEKEKVHDERTPGDCCLR